MSDAPWAALLAGLCVMCAMPAWSAAGDPSAVEWLAPAECPERAQVIAAIERHLGAPLGAGLVARIEVERGDAHGWRMILRMRGLGERVVEGDTCEEVAEAAALMVALALEAAPRAERPLAEEPARRLPVQWTAPALPAPAAPPAPPRVERRRSGRAIMDAAGPGLAWRVRSTVAYGAMALPGGGLGVSAGAALVGERLRIDLSVAHWFARTAAVAGDAMAGGRFRLEAATVRGCWRIAAWIGAGCLGAELGAMRAAGFGVERPDAVWASWAAPVVGLVRDFALTETLGIAAGADYAVALRRPRFVITGLGQVYRPGVSALRLHLGVEARFR